MSNGRYEDACCRHAIHVGQLGHCPLQFGGSFHHLHLKFVAGFANFLLGSTSFVNQVRAAEGCRCVIRSHRQQHSVSFGWEVAPLTTDGYKTGVRVEPNRNDDTAERFQSVIEANDIRSSLPAQRLIEIGKLGLQPVRKFPGGASTRDVDRYPFGGIEQAHQRKLKTQLPRQSVVHSSCNGARSDSHPRRRDGRKRNQIPKRCPQPEIFVNHQYQCVWIAPRRADFLSRSSTRNWSGGTKNGFSWSTPPTITTGWTRNMSITRLARKFVRSYVQMP